MRAKETNLDGDKRTAALTRAHRSIEGPKAKNLEWMRRVIGATLKPADYYANRST